MIVTNREVRSEKRGHLVLSRTSPGHWDSQDWLHQHSFLPRSFAHRAVKEKAGSTHPSFSSFLSPSPCWGPPHPLIRELSFHHNDRQKGLGKQVPKVPQDQRA